MDITPSDAVGPVLGGTALLWKLFDWSIQRNVKKSDDENAKRDISLAAQAVEIIKLKEDLSNARNDVKNLNADISNVRVILTEIRDGLEKSRDKQSDFYRAEIIKLEQTLRGEISRAYNPEALMRVKELEKTVGEMKTARKR